MELAAVTAATVDDTTAVVDDDDIAADDDEDPTKVPPGCISISAVKRLSENWHYMNSRNLLQRNLQN